MGNWVMLMGKGRCSEELIEGVRYLRMGLAVVDLYIEADLMLDGLSWG